MLQRVPQSVSESVCRSVLSRLLQIQAKILCRFATASEPRSHRQLSQGSPRGEAGTEWIFTESSAARSQRTLASVRLRPRSEVERITRQEHRSAVTFHSGHTQARTNKERWWLGGWWVEGAWGELRATGRTRGKECINGDFTCCMLKSSLPCFLTSV